MDVAQGGREERRIMRQRGAGFTARAVNAHFGFVFKAGPLPLPLSSLTPPLSQDSNISRPDDIPPCGDAVNAPRIDEPILSGCDAVNVSRDHEPISSGGDAVNASRDHEPIPSCDGDAVDASGQLQSTINPTKRKATKKRKALFTKKKPLNQSKAVQREVNPEPIPALEPIAAPNEEEDELSFDGTQKRPVKRMRIDTDIARGTSSRNHASDDEFKFKRVSRSKPRPVSVVAVEDESIEPERNKSRKRVNPAVLPKPDGVGVENDRIEPQQNKPRKKVKTTATTLVVPERDSASLDDEPIEPVPSKPRKALKTAAVPLAADVATSHAESPKHKRRVVKKVRSTKQVAASSTLPDEVSEPKPTSHPPSSPTRKTKTSTDAARLKNSKASASRIRKPLVEQDANSSSPHKGTTTKQSPDAQDVEQRKPRINRPRKAPPASEIQEAVPITNTAVDNDPKAQRTAPTPNPKPRTKKPDPTPEHASEITLDASRNPKSSTAQIAKSQPFGIHATSPKDADTDLFAPIKGPASSTLHGKSSTVAPQSRKAGHQKPSKPVARRIRLQIPEDDMDLSEVFDGIAAIAASESTSAKTKGKIVVDGRGRAKG